LSSFVFIPVPTSVSDAEALSSTAKLNRFVLSAVSLHSVNDSTASVLIGTRTVNSMVMEPVKLLGNTLATYAEPPLQPALN
jgi:hypothetical protein